MKVLVTGATGMVGSALTRQLVAQGLAVRILYRPTSRLDLLGSTADAVEHAVGDVTDAPSLAPAFDGITHVYHTAGFISMHGRQDGDALHAVNVQGTANVVNAALQTGITRLVHTSSIAALGRPADPTRLVDETLDWSTVKQPSAYARSKYEGELEVYRGIAEGLDAVLVNPSLIFGPALSAQTTWTYVQRLAAGKLPMVPPGATNVVDAEDVATGHRRAMVHGSTGERYLLGSENLSWRALTDLLAEALGVPAPTRTVSPMLLRRAAAFLEPLARLTGTRPLISREMAANATNAYRYSNQKAIDALGCTFRPFRETAQRLATLHQAAPA